MKMSLVRVLLLLGLSAGLPALAVPLYWDGDGLNAVGGGSGTWDTTLLRWSTTPGGSTYQAWVNNAPPDDAYFTVAGGTVAIGAPVTVQNMQFDVTGYTLSGASAITLDGTTPTVTVTTAGHTATIAAPLAGTAGLTKAGAGTLAIAGAGFGVTGGLSLGGGTLEVQGATSWMNGLRGSIFTGTPDTEVPMNLDAAAYTVSASRVPTGVKASTILSMTESPGLNVPILGTAQGWTAWSPKFDGNIEHFVTAISGQFIPTTTGSYNFRWSNDDRGLMFIDMDNSGTFEAGERVAAYGGGGSGSKTLTQNVAYNFMYMAQEHGGGQSNNWYYTPPGGSEAAVNPGAAGQVGLWKFLGAAAIGLSSTPVTATANSTLKATTDSSATFGALTVSDGVTLTTDGGPTTFASIAPTGGIAGRTVTLSNVNAVTTPSYSDGGVDTNFIKSGVGTLTLQSVAAGTGSTFRVNAGVLEAVGNNALGSAGTLTLGGGTFRELASAAPTASGADGLTALYFNFGGSPGPTSAQFASDQLYQPTRVFSRVDARPYIPWNAASNPYGVAPAGTYPFSAMPGFGTGGGNDGVLWRGQLNITTGGAYTFWSGSDDPGQLWIDGTSVVASNVSEANATVNLASGWHTFVYKFTGGGGANGAVASYSGPDTGGSKTIVGTLPGTLNASMPVLNVGTPVTVAANSTIDVASDSVFGNLSIGAFTLTTTSAGISSVTFDGAGNNTLTGNATLNASTAEMIFADPIVESGGSRTLTLNGVYRTTFQGSNTYTGTTTVSNGQLVLDADGGNAIYGNLTISANLGAYVRNVVLAQSNQIRDTATVTLQNTGVLDLGANSETITRLDLTGALTQVTGTGTLTVTNLGGSTISSGSILANLGGGGGLTKGTAGTVVLGGNNTYTGQTNVSAGILNVRGTNGLGANGLGNETLVASGAQLQLQGNITIGDEKLYLSGTGVSSDGALRNVSGTNTYGGSVIASTNTLIESDAGNLILANPTVSLSGAGTNVAIQGRGNVTLDSAPSLGGGTLTKSGPGALVFGYDVGVAGGLPAGMVWNSGILGFSGTQTLGAVTVGAYGPAAATTWEFDSDPGAGTTVTAPAGTTVIAGYAADQNLLSRFSGASAGILALTGDNANSLDFTAVPGLGLGAADRVTYSGALTPGASGYSLGGGGGAGGGARPELTVTSPLSGANALTINGTVTLAGGNTATGPVSINAGGLLRVINNTDLGDPANVVTLNGGTLQLLNVTRHVTSEYLQLGNVVSGGARTVVVGAPGGTIDVPAYSSQWDGGGNSAAFTGPNTLQGSGTLTKTGLGWLFDVASTNFSGNLTVGPNGGYFDVRGQGALPNVTSAVINQSSYLNVDNNSTLMTRQYPSYANADRFNDAATILLQGGRLQYAARNAGAGTSTETFGAVTVGFGQSEIRAERTGNYGADMILSDLIHNVGGGTAVFTAGNTIGQAGDNGRIFLNALNSVAPVNNQFIGPWATVNSDHFAVYKTGAYGANAGIGNYSGTGFAAYATTLASGNVTNLTATTALPAGGATTNALRLQGAINITFNAATPGTLTLESGGLLTNNTGDGQSIGTTTTRGVLTAGGAAAAGPQELFIHKNQGTMTIHSVIADKDTAGGVTLALVKDLGGQVNLTAANTYTGGTSLLRGTLEAQAAQALGLGPVTVKNSRLNLNVAGAIGAAAAAGGLTAVDQGEIYLNNATAAFTTNWDRFVINPGSTIIGPNARNANQGLNSLTRVAGAPAAGGQIQLLPGAIIGHQNFTNNAINGVDVATIKNLGTDADLFFGLSGNANAGEFQSITVGAGTPWMGVSTDRTSDRYWQQGTIVANSDFVLQGLLRDGGNARLILGTTNSTGSYGIVNNAGQPINAYINGFVRLDEDTPVSLPSDLTFVITPGAHLEPNRSNSLGSGSSFANVLVQAGGTLDPGNFVGIGYSVNQPYNVQYPVPGPLNGGLVTVEAGGRLWISDASGIGSGQAGNITLKADSILHLGTANAFFGMDPTTHLINPGQFVYEPGAIVRMETSGVYGMSQFVSGEPGGDRVVYEVFNGDRNLTNQVNPFIVNPTLGTSLYAPEVITVANGGMLTNDSNDRTLQEGRGRIVLGDGAVLAGTTQTYFNIQEGLDVDAGATVTVGSSRWVDGNPKLGAVQFTGNYSNTAGPGVTFSVVDGAQLSFNATSVFPDTAALNLPAAVTYWPPVGNLPPGAWQGQPGNGSTLLLNAGTGATNAEVIGALTGSGAVMGNTGAYLAVGWGAASDFTFGGVFKFANAQNPGLVKVGPTTMTLTGVSDSTADLYVTQGELEISGAGAVAFATTRVGKSGTLTLDNTAVALNNRLGGATKNIAGQGGTIELIGNATTPVTETIGNLYDGGTPTGGLSYLNVTAGAATTTFAATTIENFTGGGRQTTWVFRTPAMGNLPGTYNASNVYTPNPGNLTNGLIKATNPNFVAYNAGTGFNTGQSANVNIAGILGSPLVMTRPDILGDTDPNGQGVGFVTQDNNTTTGFRLLAASEYWGGRIVDNMTTGVNVKLAGADVVSGDTRFQSLTMAPGSSLDITGTLPLSATPSRLYLYSPGVFVQPGGAATIDGSGTYLQVAGGQCLYLHTQGDLDLNATAFSDTGIVKTGPGTLSFGPGAASIWRGTFTIDDGTVALGPSNSFYVNRGQNNFSGYNLHLNEGTLDLGGNDQIISALNSANWLPYGAAAGGTITSSAPATVTVQGGGTFSGSFAGAVSLDKVSNNTLLLTGDNPATGPLLVRQGTLQLRDEARFASASQVDINYATLLLDNGYLAGYSNRINPAATVNMRGGIVDLRGRAGTFIQENLDTVNLLQGENRFYSSPGGSGANEIAITDLNRAAGSGVFASFHQNYGFVGTPGNDTTATRYLISNLNGAAPTLTNNILPAWVIWNADHFATYLPGQGISYLSNTNDGYATYESGDLSTATATQNVNDGTARTIAASKSVNSVRFNGDITHTLNSGVTLTVNSGGILSNRGGGHGFSGGLLTSATSELDIFTNQGTMTISSQITGPISLVKGGGGNLVLTGNNNYGGTTFVDAGTLTLNRTGANATTDVALPGNLVIHNATVSESISQQISNAANVTLYGGGVLNLRDAVVTETLASLSLINNGGGTTNNVPIVTRANQQATAVLNLTAPLAVSAVSDNVTSTPSVSQNLGVVNFTRVGGAQTIDVQGSSPVGLVFNAAIGTVPTGIAEGGLVKTGPGMLHLGGNLASTFGSPAVLTDVFNIQEGIVRVDTTGAAAASSRLGSNLANTVVQSGAGLIGRASSANPIFGSIRLKAGSFLGTSEGDTTFGAATTTVGNLSTLNVAGNADIYVADYFMQGTQGYTINLNSKLTGSGNINVLGPQLSTATGTLRLGNNLTGAAPGANDYSGTITLNKNTILLAQATATALTGNELGTATINLNGGELRLRDDNTISYGNNVTLSGASTINVDRAGASATGQTITLGTLTIPAGDQVLNVTSGNTYALAFNSVAGSGTMVKAGTGTLTLSAFDAGFTGGVAIASAQGVAVAPTFGTLNITPNAIPSFTVDGLFHVPASKTLAVAGTLAVGGSPVVANGTGGVTVGSNTGALLVPNTAALSASILSNDGVIGSSGGNATLTATAGIQGSGVYQTFGQPLTLVGTLADGTSATTLKVAGNNTVSLNPGAGSTSTGGTEVQSGTLRVAPGVPSTDPLGTGPIRVFGYPAQTVGANGIPVSVASPTLVFDGGANAIALSGGITNSGTVQVAAGGTVTVAGAIAGTPTQYVPGLLEGRFSGTGSLDTSAARVANPGNFGLQLEPRGGQINVVTQNAITGWTDNDLWVYTGQFYDADGNFSFIENIDDRASVWIDGAHVLYNGSDRITSTASTVGQRGTTIDAAMNTAVGAGTMNFGMGPNGDGWHTVEIRLNNGTGGAGPWGVTNGFNNNFAFGLNTDGTRTLDGSLYTRPIDPGDASLFRTAVGGAGNITLDAGASLTAASFNLINTITLNDGTVGTPTTLRLPAQASATPSAATNLTIVGAGARTVLDIGANNTVTINNLVVPANGVLNKLSAGMIEFTTSENLGAGSLISIDGGGVYFDGTTTGGGSVAVNAGGTFGGSNNPLTTGNTLPVTVNAGGTLSPGTPAGTGILHTSDVILLAGSVFEVTLNGTVPGLGHDQLDVTGAISLAGQLRVYVGYMPEPEDFFVIIRTSLPNGVSGTFTGLPDDAFFLSEEGAGFWIHYYADSVVLQAIPEPCTLLLFGAGGLGLLLRRRRRP